MVIADLTLWSRMAVGVAEDWYRDILGIAEGRKENKAGWTGFLAHLKGLGLTCPELFILDKQQR